jgi:hypothetical protein
VSGQVNKKVIKIFHQDNNKSRTNEVAERIHRQKSFKRGHCVSGFSTLLLVRTQAGSLSLTSLLDPTRFLFTTMMKTAARSTPVQYSALLPRPIIRIILNSPALCFYPAWLKA